MFIQETESLRGNPAFIPSAAKGLFNIEQICFDMMLLKIADRKISKVAGQEPYFTLIASDGTRRIIPYGERSVNCSSAAMD